MSNKKEGILSRAFRFVFLSVGEGVNQIFKLFSPRKKNNTIEEEVEKETNSDDEERQSIEGKVRHKPSFKEFKVEKVESGNYKKFAKKLNEDSKIILIFGKRGSGKSALGLRVMENIRTHTNRKCYSIGIGADVLPQWISSIDNIHDADSDSLVLIDEGAVSFNARDSMKNVNKEISKIMAIARHKNMSIIFITQNTGMIDKNIIKLSDSLMVKEGSLLQLEMERPEIKKFYLQAKEFIDKVKDEKVKYVYVIDSDFQGLLKHDLPSFWNEKISKNKQSP